MNMFTSLINLEIPCFIIVVEECCVDTKVLTYAIQSISHINISGYIHSLVNATTLQELNAEANAPHLDILLFTSTVAFTSLCVIKTHPKRSVKCIKKLKPFICG